MNPGPFGMAQTGIPFGQVAAVRDWLEITTPIGKPPREHPKRLVTGFECSRSEVSGERLWGLFARRFGSAEKFFAAHFVANYCPLVFMEDSGRNLTPDKLPPAARKPLLAACDEHLRDVVRILQPECSSASANSPANAPLNSFPMTTIPGWPASSIPVRQVPPRTATGPGWSPPNSRNSAFGNDASCVCGLRSAKGAASFLVRHRTDSPWRTWSNALGISNRQLGQR